MRPGATRSSAIATASPSWRLRGWEANDIAAAAVVSRRAVQEWAYRYRDGGIDALVPRKPKGNTPRLTPEQQQALRQRIIDGPRGAMASARFAPKDAHSSARFGVAYKLQQRVRTHASARTRA